MIGVAKQIKWMPEFGLDRELDWLKNMHDWLISKKIGIGVWLSPFMSVKNAEHLMSLVQKELKEKAVVGWEKFEGTFSSQTLYR